jgi:hypothetical protein
MNSEQSAHPLPPLYVSRENTQRNCIRPLAAQAVDHVGEEQGVRINQDVDLTDRTAEKSLAIWTIRIIVHSADSSPALAPLAGLRLGRCRQHRGTPSPRLEVI